MNIEDKVQILQEKIFVLQAHINAVSEAISEGATSNRPDSLEDIKIDLVKRKDALEQYMSLLTTTA